MRKHRAIAEAEGTLIFLISVIGAEQREHARRFDSGFQYARREIEHVKAPLQELGMYDELMAVVARAQSLGHQGRYDDADALVYHLHQKMIRKSGSLRRLEERFGYAQPGEVRVPRQGNLMRGFGPPEPDAYQGQFLEFAAAGEIQKIVVLVLRLQGLAEIIPMFAAGRDKPVEQELAETVRAAETAEAPLKRLGLHRMLWQILRAIGSYLAGKDYAAAEELAEGFCRCLQQRLEEAAPSQQRAH